VNLRYQEVLTEIQKVLNSSTFDSCPEFVRRILSANTIVLYGAGRVGLAMQAFAKRLRHAGFNSFYLQDCTVPSTGPGDVFIVGSGSGSTPSVVAVAEVAKQKGLDVILLSANPTSRLNEISSCTILVNAPTKYSQLKENESIQPMTTLFEQSLSILLDCLILEIMTLRSETSESMKNRHNVIE
jgi:6-phospho-3-hexuloisomerase